VSLFILFHNKKKERKKKKKKVKKYYLKQETFENFYVTNLGLVYCSKKLPIEPETEHVVSVQRNSINKMYSEEYGITCLLLSK
jgi:hypothetical protein